MVQKRDIQEVQRSSGELLCATALNSSWGNQPDQQQVETITQVRGPRARARNELHPGREEEERQRKQKTKKRTTTKPVASVSQPGRHGDRDI